MMRLQKTKLSAWQGVDKQEKVQFMNNCHDSHLKNKDGQEHANKFCKMIINKKNEKKKL